MTAQSQNPAGTLRNLVHRIAISNRDQPPASTGSRNRFNGEFDIIRLEVAPAFHLGLIALFRETLEVFRRDLGGDALPGEFPPASRWRRIIAGFLADVRVLGHRAIK